MVQNGTAHAIPTGASKAQKGSTPGRPDHEGLLTHPAADPWQAVSASMHAAPTPCPGPTCSTWTATAACREGSLGDTRSDIRARDLCPITRLTLAAAAVKGRHGSANGRSRARASCGWKCSAPGSRGAAGCTWTTCKPGSTSEPASSVAAADVGCADWTGMKGDV